MFSKITVENFSSENDAFGVQKHPGGTWCYFSWIPTACPGYVSAGSVVQTDVHKK